MKKPLFLGLLFLASCFAYSSNAQVGVRVNIGLQPIWGPVGYDYVNYYYIPDLDAYYDVPNQQYMFFDGGRWIAMHDLPPRYRGFDLYHSYKVVINDPQPWMHHDMYRRRYASYRGRHDQVFIRDSHDQRYWANPNHPQHGNYHAERREHEERHDHHEEHGHGDGRRD